MKPKLIAVPLAAALIITAPGLGCYRAAAAAFGSAAKGVKVGPIAGSAAGARAAAGARIGSTPRLQVTLGGTSLGSRTPGVRVQTSGALPAAASNSMNGETRLQVQGAAAAAMRVEPAARAAAPVAAEQVRGAAVIGRALAPAREAQGRRESILARTQAAVGQLKSGRVGAVELNARVFDGARVGTKIDAYPAMSGSAISGRAATRGLVRGNLAASDRADGEVPAGFVTPEQQPPAPSKPSLWLVLGLAGGGAAAAFFAAPAVLAYLSAALPAAAAYFTVGYAAYAVAGAGALAGIALSQWPLWKEYPSLVWRAARTSAVTSFRFWARFGRIFHAILTGGDTGEAMRAPLPLNLFAYGVFAWPFVLTGYGLAPLALGAAALYLGLPLAGTWLLAPAVLLGGAPVFFAIGFLYRALGTPLQALYNGLRQLVLEFFPWLRDLLHKLIENFLPFLQGFFWGGIRAGGLGIGVGAVSLARPIWDNVVDADYRAADRRSEDPLLARVAELTGVRVLQLAGLIAAAATGVVGGALGLLLSLPYMFTDAWAEGLTKAKAEGRLARLLRAWHEAVAREDGIGRIGVTVFSARETKGNRISLGKGIVRLANTIAAAVYGALTVSAVAAVTYLRAWSRARAFVRDGKFPEAPAALKPRPDPAVGAPAPEAPAADAKPAKVWPALLLGTLGALAGLKAALALFLTGAALLSWPAIGVLAAGAAAGGALGLALSQPSAYRGFLARAAEAAGLAGLGAFRAWARLGIHADNALRDSVEDPALYRDTPAKLSRYPLLAWPGVIAGYPAAALSYAAGGVLQAAGVPLQAAWQGAVVILTSGLIRRVLRALRKLIVNAIPFALGFIVGSFQGLFQSAAAGATVLARPYGDWVLEPKGGYAWDTIPQLVMVRFVQLLGVLGFLASGLAGIVVGLVVGLPATLLRALARGFAWARSEGKMGRFFRIWEKETMPEEAERIKAYSELDFAGREKLVYWQGAVRAGNLLAHAAASPLWAPVLSAAVTLRSAWRAARRAARRTQEPYAFVESLNERLKTVAGFVAARDAYRGRVAVVFESAEALAAAKRAGLVADELEGYALDFQLRTPAPQEPARDAARSSAPERPAPAAPTTSEIVAAWALGLTGMAAGAYAAWLWGIPLLALGGWLVWAGLAGGALAGALAGFALARPKVLLSWPRVIGAGARQGAETSFGFWAGTGERFAATVAGRAPGAPVLGWGHRLVALVSGAAFGLAGVLYGIAVVPVRAGLQGAAIALENLWPLLRRFFNMIGRIARRAFPFIAGGIGGIVLGVAGTALFGALLLGRPWFRYVASEDLQTDSLGRWLGAAGTRFAAVAAGALFGVLGLGLFFGVPAAIGAWLYGWWGLSLGVLTAVPFALTLSFAMAWNLAEIGGSSQRFFDLWSRGALRRELREVSRLTSGFDFNEERTEKGELRLGDAWVRMASILAGMFAASLAAIIASLVAYPRSIYRAWRDLRDGKQPPAWDGGSGDSVVGRTVREHSRKGRTALKYLAGWAGELFAAYLLIGMLWKGFALSTLWNAVAISLLAFPAGWVAGAILGALTGLFTGVLLWFGNEIERPEKPSTR